MSNNFTIEKIQKMFIRKMNKIILDSLCEIGYHIYVCPLFSLGKAYEGVCMNCLKVVDYEETKRNDKNE